MSCSDSSVEEVIKPNGLGPFPTGQAIAVDASLSTARQTRAAGKLFEANDRLLAYVEAGKLVDGTFTPVVVENSSVNHSLYSKLLTFDFVSEGVVNTPYELDPDNTNKSSSFTESSVYYWDDFSTMTYDLRDTNPQRGIRLKYGYCYNGSPAYGETGSHITTALDEANGTIGWTVESNQKEHGTKTSDLLMATTQPMITYKHDNSQNERGTLVMPFTHAMSQFTIEIHCGPTFANPATALANTEIALHHVQAKCTVDAPAGTVAPVGGAVLEALPMHKESGTAANVKRFTAIVAPTNLTVGNILANINEVNGIPYQIDVTNQLLTGGTNAWSTQLEEDVEDAQEGVAQAKPRTRAATIDKGKGYRTKPGVNYKLVVTVDKQKITVYATITDWVEVEAQTVGTINFSNDITTKETTSLGNYEWFDVFRAPSTANTNLHFDENISTNDKIDEATTYSKTGTTWGNTPAIYWPYASDRYYFRALGSSKERNDLYTNNLVISSSTSGSDYITIKNGATNDNDMIWGTTPAHRGPEAENPSLDYAEGAAIAPRTGDVPLSFKHLLTKVSFILKTSTDAAQAVNLEGAWIQISNIYNECHLNLSTGETAPTGTPGYLYSDNSNTIGRATTYTSNQSTLSNQIVTPQTIADGAMIIITLADGTTYKAQLNQCTVTDTNGAPTSTKIGTWEQGNHYTYTIHLEKEAAIFRAMIKEWDERKGSGNATLDWD